MNWSTIKSRLCLVLLQGLDEIDIVKFSPFVSEVSTQQGVLVVAQGQLVVVQDGAHSREGHAPDLRDVLVLEEGLDQ